MSAQLNYGVLLHATALSAQPSALGSKPTSSYRELLLFKECNNGKLCKDFSSSPIDGARQVRPYVLLRYDVRWFDNMGMNYLLQSDIYTHLVNVMRDKLTYYCMLHHISFHRSLNPYSRVKKKNRLYRLFHKIPVKFKRNTPKDFLPLKVCSDCITTETTTDKERTFITHLIEELEDHLGFLLTISRFSPLSSDVMKAVQLHKLNFKYVTAMINSVGEIVGIDRTVVDLMLPNTYGKDSDYSRIKNDILLKSYGIQYIITDFYIKHDKMIESRCIPVNSSRGAFVVVCNWYSTITLTVEYDLTRDFLLIKY